MRIIFVIVFLIMIFSCQKSSEKKYKENILGNWKLVLFKEEGKEWETLPRSIFSGGIGYQFLKDGICEKKNGFFKHEIDYDKEVPKTRFLGTKTKYIIEGDTLRIYDLENEEWYSKKILKISHDSLILEYGGQISSFKRQDFSKIETLDYDQIILSSSGCYGVCPIMNISIGENRKVFFQGQNHVEHVGFYESELQPSQLKKLIKKFDDADILKLKKEYYSSVTDDENIDVTFIKNGKIVKTISDYAKSAPDEFIWAYTSMRLLHQDLVLDSIIPKPKFDMHYSYLFYENDSVYIPKSEIFFLQTELLRAKEVKANIDGKYKFKYGNTNFSSDGRFYRVNGKTLDLGYDFIARNDLFSKKN